MGVRLGEALAYASPSDLDQGRVVLHVPKEVNGREGQGAVLLTRASAKVRAEPAVVSRAEPLLK
jgi:hypothetical protein